MDKREIAQHLETVRHNFDHAIRQRDHKAANHWAAELAKGWAEWDKANKPFRRRSQPSRGVQGG